jgi:hypothetical protein
MNIIRPQTNNNDWLFDLAKNDNKVLLSDDDFVFKLFGQKTHGEYSIRFVGNSVLGYKLLFLVKFEDIMALKKYKNEIYELCRYFKEVFSSSEEMPVIACNKKLSEVHATRFAILDKEKEFILTDKNGLAHFFHKIDPKFSQNTGFLLKDINRSVHDDFQLFTRTCLSRFVVANDIDGIINKSNPVLLETKRVSGDPSFWRPYIDDHSNYKSLSFIASKIPGASNLTIAYSNKYPGRASVHVLEEVNKLKIVGREKTIWNVKDLESLCDITPTNRYTSLNFRQKSLVR